MEKPAPLLADVSTSADSSIDILGKEATATFVARQ